MLSRAVQLFYNESAVKITLYNTNNARVHLRSRYDVTSTHNYRNEQIRWIMDYERYPSKISGLVKMITKLAFNTIVLIFTAARKTHVQSFVFVIVRFLRRWINMIYTPRGLTWFTPRRKHARNGIICYKIANYCPQLGHKNREVVISRIF